MCNKNTRYNNSAEGSTFFSFHWTEVHNKTYRKRCVKKQVTRDHDFRVNNKNIIIMIPEEGHLRPKRWILNTNKSLPIKKWMCVVVVISQQQTINK